MRIVIDIMIGSMLVAVVAGGFYLYNTREENEREVESVRVALQQLQEQAAYHTTVQSAIAERDVLLVHLHQEWFGEDLPTNALLSSARPWIDLAPPGDLGQHPPDPVAYGEDQAGFWYNPTNGVFRARVSPASSEAQTLALYNAVNGTELQAFEQIPDPSRQPLAHTPGKTPAKQYASMANKTWSETVEPADTLKTDLLIAGPDASSELSTQVPLEKNSPEEGLDLGDSANEKTLEESPLTIVEVVLELETRPTLKND